MLRQSSKRLRSLPTLPLSLLLLVAFALPTIIVGCDFASSSTSTGFGDGGADADDPFVEPGTYPAIEEYLGLDLNNLPNYTDPGWPAHYNAGVFAEMDNTPGDNPITNRGATLGRVLFHDERLSINDTISCASCHAQPIGFTDSAQFSLGFNGTDVTGAHSTRLGNARFYPGLNFFWDRRAPTLEFQTTQPIRNAVEMGWDEAAGSIPALIVKMETDLPYYAELFEWVYGDSTITEDRMQRALAQFVRAMASVSSRFDSGFASVYNDSMPGDNVGAPFPNYTAEENRGKQLFTSPPNRGGVGCQGCHRTPTFGLSENSRSNGLDAGETIVFKSPSLKNIGVTGPYMHDGRFNTLAEVVEFYDSGVQDGPALDNRLRPGGNPIRLNLSVADKAALVAFMETLTDDNLNNDPKFADPFIK